MIMTRHGAAELLAYVYENDTLVEVKLLIRPLDSFGYKGLIKRRSD